MHQQKDLRRLFSVALFLRRLRFGDQLFCLREEASGIVVPVIRFLQIFLS